jgi:hypothetical protein
MKNAMIKNPFYIVICMSFIFFMLLVVTSVVQKTHADIQQYLLTDKGLPTPALKEMLALFNVPHDGTLKSIVDATQKVWLRPKDKERWQVEDVLKDKAEHVIPLLEKLGCINAIVPQSKQYTYALILGATAPAMRNRLAYLLQRWQAGVTFDALIFLLSERPADPVRESKEVLLSSTTLPIKKEWQFNGMLPRNEYEVMRFIYDQADLPAGFAAIPVFFVNGADNNKKNANTMDTIIAWLSTKPEPGSCLFVSSQPYVGYQDSAVRTLMPSAFKVETIGAAASKNDKITSYVDTIARWLYQEQKRRTKT